MNRLALAGLLMGLLAAPRQAQTEAELPELGLTLSLPPLKNLEEAPRSPRGQTRASWTGKLPSCDVRISLVCLSTESFGFSEAGGVNDAFVGFFRRARDFDVTNLRFLSGPYGISPVLSVATGTAPNDDAPMSEYIATGLIEDYGYGIHIECMPPPSTKDAPLFDEFFESGIVYTGELRDPNWKTDEIVARWKKDAPDDLHRDFEVNVSKKAWFKKSVLRTKNYLIMTNASGGKNFAKQMEKNYKEIVKTFPFDQVEGRKLMPVFLFRDAEQYYQFCVRMGQSYEQAKRSGGHAWKDYYATWYKSPKDPVHIHEQTHQIFSQRLFLKGGGSWYQEGVAEYVGSTENERNIVANQAKKGRHDPLPRFFQRTSLLHSAQTSRARGGSEASDLYKQAALFIEFLRESQFGAERFERFLESMGHVPRGNLEKITEVFEAVYGVSIEELNSEFMAYCKKR